MNHQDTGAGETLRRPRMSPASAAYRLTKQYSDGVKAASTIAPKTQELVKVRASQINGCAFCLDMHAREALELGEDPRRLYARVRGHYSEEQYLDLLLLIGVINVWNRLSVALHSTPPVRNDKE